METTSFNVSQALLCNKSKEIGKKIIYKETTKTTMDDAREYGLNGEPHGTAIIAETQTDARGAKNNKWSALHTRNIFVSFILHCNKLDQGFANTFRCEVAAALAVLEAVQELGVTNIQTKWQNDLWVRGHKLAGFLMEEVDFTIQGTCPLKQLTVLGLGLNVNSDVRRNPGLRNLATSVKCELGGQDVNREELFAKICYNLEVNLNKHSNELHQRYVKHQLFQPGVPVVVHGTVKNEAIKAHVVEIKDDWNIVFQDESTKEVVAVDSGSYSLRPRCTKIIYIISSGHSEVISSHFVYRSLVSIVDISQYSIRFLKTEDIVKDFWLDNGVLVVMSDIEKCVDADWTTANKQLELYLSNGGRLLTLGQSSSYLPLTKQFIEEVKTEDSNDNISLIGIRFNNSTIVHGEQPDSCNMCYHSKYLTFKSDPQHDQVLASYNGTDNQPAIVTKSSGNGKICLCGFNLEITFEDLENYVATKSCTVELEENVFKQDLLLENILKVLDVY